MGSEGAGQRAQRVGYLGGEHDAHAGADTGTKSLNAGAALIAGVQLVGGGSEFGPAQQEGIELVSVAVGAGRALAIGGDRAGGYDEGGGGFVVGAHR